MDMADMTREELRSLMSERGFNMKEEVAEEEEKSAGHDEI
jgi:hypothetical protein